ncbi:FAD-binding protein [Streptomyces diacarni]|uniref:FAD-binding protein n=1 Tax=Streptomyces diacarni TaxID=2800381 RepID=A0A367FF32_9ACTN|nr:NAD(P)/FAD-dependent oxidoreductase [Streptomyces diacarni]RCG28442.1 FAD-binding protein [Streptomyces diacarni]
MCASSASPSERARGPRNTGRRPGKSAAADGGPRVLVLGAGIAGLVVAYELERLGFRVEVLEGAPHVGGRIRTHRFGAGPGAPAVELGAMRIPADHTHTLTYVRLLGLEGELRPFATLLSEERAKLRTAGGFVRVQDAAPHLCADFRAKVGLPRPHRAEDRRAVLFGAWLTAVVDAIAPADLREELSRDMGRRLVDMVARTDLEPFLRGPDADRLDLQGVFAAHPRLRAACGVRLNSFLDDVLTETSPHLLRLCGGMDRLPRALARRLRGPVRCGHRAVALTLERDEVRVLVRAGRRTRTHRAELAVCTLPFPALRGMRLGGLDEDKLAVLDEVVYCPATKVAFHCREPFWPHDSGIRGGASFTGGRIRQTYYPPVADATDDGAALVASYTIGPEAAWLGRLPQRRRHRLVLDELSTLHPQLRRPGMVRAAVSVAWGSGSPLDAGCTTRWGMGAREVEAERVRAARPVHRLFFAGEHCSTAPAWIEGAIESALRAVAGVAHSPVVRRHGAPPAGNDDTEGVTR